MSRKKGKKYVVIVTGICLLVMLVIGVILFAYFDKKLKEEKETLRLQNIKDSYNTYMVMNKESDLYNDEYEKAGTVSKGMYLILDELGEEYKDGYYKLKNNDLYVKYDSLVVTEEKKEERRYKNYVPFNKNVVTNEETKIYADEDIYYTLKDAYEFPVIIDDEDKYYVSFDDKLLYVFKDSVEVKETDDLKEYAKSLAVLNYHYVINIEAGEAPLCDPASICLTDTQFDSQMKYISENSFYTITMKELEMFIDGKINLPKKSVAVTIDDGWFVGRAIPILEKYNIMGTLFLIGYLAPATDYASPNLEVHSHTWNLHNISNCPGGRSPLLCYDKNVILEDLKMSRESLNNTTYFCYPFYDYNDHAIDALKETGFTMALTGGEKKVTRGIDKYKVPRYVVISTTTIDELAKMIN